MGTDIHIAIEKLDNDGWHWTAIASNCNRNYDLFAILADVRNGTGFAGVVTGKGFVPISEPRGFPLDMDPQSLGPRWKDMPGGDTEWYEVYNPQTKQYEDAAPFDWESYKDRWLYRVASGDHSETWLLASEIFNYDLSQKTLQCGVMSEEDYKKYHETGELGTYSGGISGNKVITLEESQYRAMEKGKRRRLPEIDYYIQCWWEISYEECIGYWVDELRGKLTAEGLTDFDKVRLVFNFDS
jgi:hypothetical protein